MGKNILALNAGSSSVKFRAFRMDKLVPLDQSEEVLAQGKVERIGKANATMTFSIGGAQERTEQAGGESLSSAVETILNLCSSIDIQAAGHRIVHGGPKFFEPVVVDQIVLADIRALTPLAPLHNPSGIAGIETCQRLLPKIRNVAVFDTAFHHNLPAVAATYALPRDLSAKLQLRRYGFHGISYSYVSERLKLLVGKDSTRHVICHLGSGASICAIKDGASVDTSMGFTPLEGLIMGTRSGDVDPGLLLHLHQALGWTAEEVDDLLNHKSGLLGLSRVAADVRELEAASDEGSAFALECFVYRISKYIGAYAAALGGIDALVFTGGIGQFSSKVRGSVCCRLGFLGLSVDEGKNREAAGKEVERIGDRVWIVPTDEERQIARQTLAVKG
jgi:acetate kinase